VNRGRRRLLATGVAVAAAPATGPAQATPEAFMQRALAMREQAVASGDQAYGAVVVLDGRIVGEAPSAVVTRDDPTAHAEMEAIRDAARRLGRRDLGGAVLYSSSRPCPMCEAAAYWAGIAGMIHGSALTDAGAPGLGRC
jgi:tRNA(Arg) A34 adenosine deaminase TadA